MGAYTGADTLAAIETEAQAGIVRGEWVHSESMHRASFSCHLGTVLHSLLWSLSFLSHQIKQGIPGQGNRPGLSVCQTFF